MNALSKVQREALHCLRDNDGDMRFEDLAFDMSPHTTPQGLGRSLSTMVGLGFVTLYRSNDDAHSVGITDKGEAALAAEVPV